MYSRRNFLVSAVGIPGALAGSSDPRKSASTCAWWPAACGEQAPSLFLDAGVYSPSRSHLERATSFLEESGLESTLVLGLHGTALAHAFGASAWSRWSLHTVVGSSPDEAQNAELAFVRWTAGISSSYPGRVTVLACGRTLRRWLARVSANAPDETVEGAARSLLAPTVLVPAMVVAAVLAQQQGASYVLSTP